MRLKHLFFVCAAVAAGGCAQQGQTDAVAVSPPMVAIPAGPAPGTPEHFAATVPTTVYFGVNSAMLSAETVNALNQQLGWLMTYRDAPVVVEGHTDIRGQRRYNMALGQRRANAVAQYLYEHGVAQNRLSTISYGPDRPAEPGISPEADRANRRAVTIVARPASG